MADTDTTSVEIDTEIISTLNTRIKFTEFSTVDDYVNYVLEEMIDKLEEIDQDVEGEVDSEEVEDRLRSLGYLEN